MRYSLTIVEIKSEKLENEREKYRQSQILKVFDARTETTLF